MFCACSACVTSFAVMLERLQPVRIEPDPHRVVAAAEHRDRADAVDARERVLDLERRVIRDEQRVARLVGRDRDARPSSGRARTLSTVTPILRTSAGSRGCAMPTRFCTCTCAISRLVPMSKVTAIEKRPSAVAFDDM